MKNVTVGTWVSNDAGRNGNGAGEYSLVNYYFLNDTAPDYPYITSHTSYTVKSIEKNVARYTDSGYTREEGLTSIFISACDDDYKASYTWKSNYVIGQEEVKVECGGLDYESSDSGYPLYMYNLIYEDGELVGWYEDSIGNTVGCVYSDGTTEYWGTLPSTNDGSVKFLTKLN
jgi:hypothetical protein